ncbi:MAG: hypothetical protein ACRDNZ_17975 [Streptosporangiaceae bacterium]
MTSNGRAWVAGLPEELAGQRAILTALLGACEADQRIRWLVIGCSLARGAADPMSDLDMAIGIEAAEFEAACPDIRAVVDGLGDLVDSFQHRLPDLPGPHLRIFAQYSGRCQVDLVVLPDVADVGSVPNVVVLHDPGQVVTVAAQRGPVTPEQAREWAFLGWCALIDLGKYLRRGSPWEARGRLEEARAQLWKLQATAGKVADPRYGLTSILDFVPAIIQPAMAATVAGLAPAALLTAARQLARLLSAVGDGLDADQRAALPAAMDCFVRADLDAMELPPDIGAPVRA